MHIDLNLVSIVFRCSIFVLFVYKLYQIFIKEKLKNYLEAGLQESRNEHIEFVEKGTLLVSTRKRIERQLDDQNKNFAILEKKYAQFLSFEQNRATIQNNEMIQRVDAIEKKRILQIKNISQAKQLSESVPLAMQEANGQLKSYYKGDKGAFILRDYVKLLV